MSSHFFPWRVYSTHAIFATDPAPLWKLLEDFNGLPALLPDVVKSSSVEGSGVGAVRTLQFDDDVSAKERLISFHSEQFRLSYGMDRPEGFPWDHYFCTQQLQALGAGQTHLMITGYYQPREGTDAEAREGLAEVYHSLFKGLAKKLGVGMAVQTS